MVPEYLTIAEAAQLIAAKGLSPVELLDSRLQRIERFDGRLNSFIRVLADEARAAARTAEAEIAAGRYRDRCTHPNRSQGYLRDCRRRNDWPFQGDAGPCAGNRRLFGSAAA